MEISDTDYKVNIKGEKKKIKNERKDSNKRQKKIKQ